MIRRDAARALRVLPLLWLPLASALQAQAPKAGPAPRAMTARDLWSMGRVGAPAISPDGRRVAYAVTRYDLDSYKSRTDIWIVPVAGGEPVQVTSATSSSSQPAWSPDGHTLAFISGRGGNGPQVYLLPLDGGEARALTSVLGGADGPVWSPDGKSIAFASSVWPAGDAAADRLKQLSESKSQARIYDELMFRHWDEWTSGQRSHVFVADVATGGARDVTPGPYDTPPIALAGFQEYAFSPDGKEMAFSRNTDVPTSVGTGNDVWTVALDGAAPPRRLTESKANDVSPQYSPDGRYIAYLAMARPGFEADLAQIAVVDRRTGERRILAPSLDRPVAFFAWSADSKTVYFLAQDELLSRAYRVPAAGGEATPLTEGTFNSALAVAPDGRTMVVARQSVKLPVELFALDGAGKTLRQLTHVNDTLLSQLALLPAEPFWFEGAAGARVEGFIVRPPDFDPARKYPVVYLVHGGPQGAWEDSWSYRWNPAMFAAPGYVAVLVNFHGSTGYGQKFTDEISGDWGGEPFDDLMKGLDAALQKYPFLDRSRMVAAGASYGGYMMNWFEGHTDRFRAIINHDGMFNTFSAYASTEELWFPEWEFRGMPWSNRDLYEKWNPANFVQNFKTPMLVIHGGLDFRLPLEQGLEAFTTLRRRGIRARLLYFPDEGHWVLKPQNAMVWWDTMYGWMREYMGPAS